MGIPDAEALDVWNDLSLCERFGWRYDYVKGLSAQEHINIMNYLDARSKIGSSILKG